MRKEVIPFMVAIGIIFLNFPIAILLYFFAPDIIEKVFLILIPFELILIGFLEIKIDLDFKKNDRKDCDTCIGTIQKFEFVNINNH